MDLKYLFRPSSMAVIGVSTTQDSHPANVIYTKNHLRYPVKTYAVNPKGGQLNREPLYRQLGDIEGDVDMAVIAVRAQFVPGVVEQCIKKGVRGAVIISGGFSESGNHEL
ncbi:MAG: CoA-binding protein, partial [Desulfobacteraceae bacterium]|nr:CoA-binding protein [Desulfobacteraceae bacterium]